MEEMKGERPFRVGAIRASEYILSCTAEVHLNRPANSVFHVAHRPNVKR